MAVVGRASPRVVSLPYLAASVPQARSLLRDDLVSAALPEETVADALVVLSELLANALRHARPLASGQVRTAWTIRPAEVEIRVTDGGGPNHPVVNPPSTSAPSGRGLAIVAALARQWGVEREGPGVTVYAVLGG